ncbi:hypothetical protein ACODT5_01265 [Streptomyces sp. 5.8]|uniref:hypothetical protein n=1 Tax=Streptomyces sp. 5.8 TaxID=3406571 RepID=UPI003BB568A3
MKIAALAVNCATALLVTLLTGCGQNGTTVDGDHAGSPTVSPAGLPAGIVDLGSEHQLARGTWKTVVHPLGATSPPADGSLPSGWSAARMQVDLTNTSSGIALLPDITVTVRIGELGLETVPFTEQNLAGFPKPDAGIKVKPGATFSANLGIAIPPHTAGQRATVTLEATQAGLAQAEAVFFEGKLTGSPTDTHPTSAGSTAPPGSGLALGQWSSAGVRVSPLQLDQDKGGWRDATLELSVRNTTDKPRSGMGVTLRILVGTDLFTADTVSAGLGYQDAPIAPHRTATHLVRVSVPSRAVPGPVAVQAELRAGAQTLFEGTLR